MANSTKIDSLRDFTPKGLRELESWLEPWFRGKMRGIRGTGGGGETQTWEDVGTTTSVGLNVVAPRGLTVSATLLNVASLANPNMDFSSGVSQISTNDRTGSYEGSAPTTAWAGQAFNVLAAGSAKRIRLIGPGLFMFHGNATSTNNYGPVSDGWIQVYPWVNGSNWLGYSNLESQYGKAADFNATTHHYKDVSGFALLTVAGPHDVYVSIQHNWGANIDFTVALSIAKLNWYTL